MKIALAGRLLASTLLLSAVVVSAKRPDPQLLSLVPPDSQIVAGAAAPLEGGSRGNFLIFTRANTLDLADFFSVVGADASHKVNQVIFAASAQPGHANLEHSVLVSGNFDAKQIYRSESTSATSFYHGVKVIVLRPFERERAFLMQDRWFATLDSRLSILGTISSAQEEIDRYLSGAAPDTSIVQRLSSLRSADDTWCFISSLELGAEIPRVLKDLDPALSDIDEASDTILFGIRYGRQIEFEYVVNALRGTDPVPGRLVGSSFNSANRGLSSARDSELSVGTGSRRVVKISRGRYDRWLEDLTAH